MLYGTWKARNVESRAVTQNGCYKVMLKSIYPCKGRGMTDETSVMEVEE